MTLRRSRRTQGFTLIEVLVVVTVPARARRLEGSLERIERPAEVALFCDGGYEKERQLATLLITNGNPHGPYLENVERATGRLPHTRHTEKGGIAVAFADGSGKFARPLSWMTSYGRRYVKRYTPRVRVSPYNVGAITTDYDNPGKWP